MFVHRQQGSSPVAGPPGEPSGEMGQWIKDLAATHRTFAEKLANLHPRR